jgi:Protein of unknown function (DUF1566)
VRARLAAALMIALATAGTRAAESPAKITPSVDGRELLDTSAGLSWSRCVEGMQWDGRHCSGEAMLATHAQALALARARSAADGHLWRVPRVQEFKRLHERLGTAQQAALLMPGAPGGWHWSGTLRIESEAVNAYSYRNVERGTTERQIDRLATQTGWAVEQPGGAVRDMPKRQKLPVRLVRALTP